MCEVGWKELAFNSFSTFSGSASFWRMESARRSIAPGISFSLGTSAFSGTVPAVLDVLQRGINANLIAELGVLAPNHTVGGAEISHATNDGRIQFGSRGNAQVGEYLMQTVGTHSAQLR